jgi:hypothetical protein
MKIAGLTVSVDGDTKPLEDSLSRAKDRARQGGQDISDALGQGMAGAGDHYKELDDAGQGWLERHKKLIAEAAAVTAGIWAYTHQDQAKAYWDQATQYASDALDSMKSGLSDFADHAQKSFGTVEDAVNTLGEAIGRGTLYSVFDGLGDRLERMGKQASDLGAEIQKTAELKNLPVHDLSVAQSVGPMTNGTSPAEMTAMLEKVKDAQDGASDSAKQMQQQYALLGVSLKNADGSARDQMAVITDVSNTEQKWGDQTKVLTANQILFGSALTANTNDLLKYPATMQAAMDAASKGGLTLSDSEIATLKRVHDEQETQAAFEQAWALKRSAIYAETGDAIRTDALQFLDSQKTVYDTLGSIWGDAETGLKALTQNFLDSHELMAHAMTLVMDHGGNDFANWLQNDLPQKIVSGWQTIVNALGDMMAQAVQYAANLMIGILNTITSSMEKIPSFMRGKMGLPDDAQIADQKQAAKEIADTFENLAINIQSFTAQAANAVNGNLVKSIGASLQTLGQMAKDAVAHQSDQQAAQVAIAQARRHDEAMKALADPHTGPERAPDPSKGSGSDNDELEEYVKSLNAKAMESQSNLLGDKYGAKDQKNLEDYHKALVDLSKDAEKYSGTEKDNLLAAGKYWAEYRLGIEKAANALDHARHVLGEWADNEVKIGQATGDPSRTVSGQMTKLGVDLGKQFQDIDGDSMRTDAQKAAAKAQAQEAADQSAIKIHQDALGDFAKLDDGYWARKQEALDKDLAYVKANSESEYAYRVYASQQQDKLNQQYLQSRIGTEESFSTYLQDRLSLDEGLYKSAIGQQLDAWNDYYSQLKQTAESWGNDFKSGMTDLLGDLFSGGTKKAAADWKAMLDKMRKDLLNFVSGEGTDWLKNLFKSAMGSGGGSSPGGAGGSSGSDSSYGMAGRDGVQALLPGVQSYGLSGLIAGTSGAPSIINALTSGSSSTSGTSSVFTGGDSGNSVSGSTISINGIDTSGLSSGSASDQVAQLMSRGVPQSDALQIVMSGAGSSGTPFGASSGVNPATSSSMFSTSSLLSDAKDLGSLASLANSGVIGSINAWGANTLGIGSEAIPAVESEGNIIAPAIPAGATGGLGTTGVSALGGAGIGYLAGSLMEPQGSGASIAGAAGGAIAGGTAAALGEGALASTGIGALVAIPAAAITALLSPSTTTTSPNGNNGITVDMTSSGMNGANPLWGYEGFTQTSTGSFGDSSTSHFTEPTIADPATAQAWNQDMGAQNASLSSSLNTLGVGTGSLSDYSFPFQFNVTSQDASQAAINVANAMATVATQASSLATQFNNALEPGEDYIDEITRISSAYSATNVSAQVAGTSLANLSGASDVVSQGNWASEVGQLLGGNQNTTAAFQTYINSMSKLTVAANTLTATSSQANQAIGLIGDAGVNQGNFWDQYGQAMQSPMDPTTLQAWTNAATAMAAFDSAEQQAGQAMQSFNNLQIEGLQAQIAAAQSLTVMVNGLQVSVSSAYSTFNSLSQSLTSTLQSIQWNSSLSPNTPEQTYQQQSAYFQQLAAQVQNEGPSSLTYTQDIQQLQSFAQTFLQTSKSVNGMSAAYTNDYNTVQGVLQTIKAPIDQQLATLQSQLTAQDQLVNSAQAQITQLQLSNTNLQLVNNSISVLGADTVNGFNNMSSAMSQIAGVVTTLQASYSVVGAALGLPAFAEGGDFGGGFRLVGERGPEIELTGPARYLSAAQTRDIMAARGSGAGSLSDSAATAAIVQGNAAITHGLGVVAKQLGVTHRVHAAVLGYHRLQAAQPSRMRRA